MIIFRSSMTLIDAQQPEPTCGWLVGWHKRLLVLITHAGFQSYLSGFCILSSLRSGPMRYCMHATRATRMRACAGSRPRRACLWTMIMGGWVEEAGRKQMGLWMDGHIRSSC